MKLYGHRGSMCTNRVLFVLAEKSAEAEFVAVDLAKGEHKRPEHLARHPFGMLPVLEEGEDFSLYESRAIIRHLDAALPGPRLTPDDARDRAEMERWISVEQSYVSPPVSEILKQKFLVPAQGGKVDVDALDVAKAAVSKALDVIDRALTGRTYLAGSFSLADISLAPVLLMLFVTGEGDLVLGRPNLAAWWKRVSSREGWQRVLAGGGPPPKEPQVCAPTPVRSRPKSDARGVSPGEAPTTPASPQ